MATLRANKQKTTRTVYVIEATIRATVVELDAYDRSLLCEWLCHCARFSGAGLLAHCCMPDRILLVTEFGKQKRLALTELEERMLEIYSRSHVSRFRRRIDYLNALGEKNEAERMRGRMTRRMGNLPAFMATLKKGYTHRYNTRHCRTGGLWDSGYRRHELRGQTVEDTMSAYVNALSSTRSQHPLAAPDSPPTHGDAKP